MSGLLSGLRVIDSTTMVAMPTAMHIMAEMGAEVVKVESHTLRRGEGGILPENELGERPWDREGSFNVLQRSKLGVTLNLRADEGIEAFRDLVRVSDVLVENNRAGTMDRLGLGYQDLRNIRPDLIYLSNTGFGYTGPWRRYAGIGRMFELTCGLSQFTGYPDEGPRRVGASFFDLHVGWTAVFAILTALHHRKQTGTGQWIDFAMYQIGVSTIGDAILDYVANDRNGGLMGNRHSFQSPHGVYPCRGEDKWIAIAPETDAHWDALCGIMGSPPWTLEEKFADPLSRWHNQDEMDKLLGGWTLGYDHTELMLLLQEAGVPAGAVLNSGELFNDPHLKDRGFYERVDHHPDSGLGVRAYFSRPWKMSETPASISMPAPMLGEHNELVLGDLLGRSEPELAELYEAGVVGKEPSDPRFNAPPTLEQLMADGTAIGYDPDYMKAQGG